MIIHIAMMATKACRTDNNNTKKSFVCLLAVMRELKLTPEKQNIHVYY